VKESDLKVDSRVSSREDLKLFREFESLIIGLEL
jgi:hypothetical protein